MAGSWSPPNFNGTLAGFTAQARNIVIDLCSEGWHGRLSSKGHAIMYSPDGVSSVAISRSVKNARASENILAEIKRVKDKHASGMTWLPVGETSTVLTNGERFRCGVCDEEFDTTKLVVGHYVYTHTKSLDRTGIPSHRKGKKMRETFIPITPIEAPEVEIETPEAEVETPEAEHVAPAAEVQEANDALETITAWVESFPLDAIKDISNVYAELARLRADNKRLREGLKALAELAKDV